MSTELAAPTGPKPITERAREAFHEEQVAVIRDTVAKDCSPAQLHMFLEIAARHELDPFLGEIYAAKMGNKDGQSGRVVIMVPRDGFLAKAQRNSDYEGMDGDVVRKGDDFKVHRLKDGTREVEHSYNPTSEEGRGEILGAWAIVYRTGRKPTYFFANMSEYKPSGRKLEVSPWSKQESAMILKCAESTCLRKAFSITGVAGAEEMQRQMIEASVVSSSGDEIDWGTGASAEQLKAYFDRLNEISPGLYKPAKIRVMLRGKTPAERTELIGLLAHEIEDLGGEVPEPDEGQDGEEEAVLAENEEEVITDADVVPDDEDDEPKDLSEMGVEDGVLPEDPEGEETPEAEGPKEPAEGDDQASLGS